MRIKAVCEATGLTDRTVRYYIEELLIDPFYTENYLGRKTYDFSESDIRMLNDIAVLRKFGFSIAEIKEMLLHPEEIHHIVRELQNRKQAVIHEEQQLLQALLRVEETRCYTMTELAECLSAPVVDTPLPTEDTKLDIGKLVTGFVKAVLIGSITWLPVVLCVLLFIDDLRRYHYPKVDPVFIVLSLLALLPTWLTLLQPRVSNKFKCKSILKNVHLTLCVLTIPISSIFTMCIIDRSETTDIGNYLDLDPECIANRSVFFQKLFPNWPHYFVVERQPNGHFIDIYLDAYYYYHFYRGFDYTYDIYAEWPLEKEDFDEEVTRVKALFEEQAPEEEIRSEYHDYVTIQQGSYECLIIYYGDIPFEEVTSSYTYYIFAYDEENLRVRYIYCDSLENGADQPYYLSLDW